MRLVLLRARRKARRRLGSSFAVSLLAHAAVLALALVVVHRPVRAPEWLPPPSFDMLFEGGAKPSVVPNKAPPKPNQPISGAEQRASPPPFPTPSPAPTERAAPTRATPLPPVPQTPPERLRRTPTPPPPPVQTAPVPEEALPLPPPRPAPAPVPRPATPVFPAPMNFSFGRPLRMPVPAAPRGGNGAVDLSFAPPNGSAASVEIYGRHDSKTVGPDWSNEFAAWWAQHGYYPRQAGENGESGDVTVDLVVRRDGLVRAVSLTDRSGSTWLDMAAVAVFRDAHLPALPSTSADTVPLTVTIHYVIVRR